MVSILSKVIENRILRNLKESKHMTIIFNESTDCTITEQLVIHCRYIAKDTSELQSYFLKVTDVLGLSHWNRSPLKIGPVRPILAENLCQKWSSGPLLLPKLIWLDQFWQPKLVPLCQFWSPVKYKIATI